MVQPIFFGLRATAQSSLNNKETTQALGLRADESNCIPKNIVGDEALTTELMVSENVPVVQEPHGQTELIQLFDFLNDNGCEKPDARANYNRNLSQPALCGFHSSLGWVSIFFLCFTSDDIKTADGTMVSHPSFTSGLCLW